MIHNTVTWMHLRSGNRENISSVRRSARSVFCARRLLWTVWKSIISLIRALHWLSRNHHCERQRPKALFFNSQCRPTFSNSYFRLIRPRHFAALSLCLVLSMFYILGRNIVRSSTTITMGSLEIHINVFKNSIF